MMMIMSCAVDTEQGLASVENFTTKTFYVDGLWIPLTETGRPTLKVHHLKISCDRFLFVVLINSGDDDDIYCK